jgi:SPP1 family predicted phage head-tail adaptor
MTTGSNLTDRIRIERRVKAGTREVTYTWELEIEVWAQWLPLRTRDMFAAGQIQPEITGRFRIRRLAGLDSTMRVVWDGVPYQIKGQPVPVPGREWMDLNVLAGVADSR